MKFNISFYALRKDGVYGCASLFGSANRPGKFAVNDGGESRLEDGTVLYTR